MSKPTTLGRALFDDALPGNTLPEGSVNKKALYGELGRYARANPELYGGTVDAVKRLGDYVATSYGISVGLDDISPDTAARDPLVTAAMRELRGAKTDAQRRDIIRRTQGEMMSLAPTHKSDMAIMARSGGRGNAAQLMRTVVASAAATDVNGQTLPWLIQRSYAEGLRADEAWVAGEEARIAAIQTKESVQEPGAFGKVMVANMSDQIITATDCGTTSGSTFSLDDDQVMDRVLATTQGGVAAGTPVTGPVLSELKRAKLDRVKVRTTLTCEQTRGICAKCWGLNEWGKFPAVNTNMGVRSAHAMQEPLTQMALNSKHGVRTAGGELTAPDTRGLAGLKNFLDFPASFASRAVLADRPGVVSSVKTAPQGGWNVSVGGQTYYLNPSVRPRVAVGDRVDAGDALSGGVPTPDEVVRLKGLGAGRQHVADTVHGIFKDQGNNLDKRHTELLAKSFLGYVRVVDDPEGVHLPGEIVPYSSVTPRYSAGSSRVPLEQAVGKTLGEAVETWTAGTELTRPILASMQQRGVTDVAVTESKLRTRPVVKGLTRTPLLDSSWMRRLGHRYITDSIRQGATAGESSDVHGTDPVSAYAHGASFGQSPSGVGY